MGDSEREAPNTLRESLGSAPGDRRCIACTDPGFLQNLIGCIMGIRSLKLENRVLLPSYTGQDLSNSLSPCRQEYVSIRIFARQMLLEEANCLLVNIIQDEQPFNGAIFAGLFQPASCQS